MIKNPINKKKWSGPLFAVRVYIIYGVVQTVLIEIITVFITHRVGLQESANLRIIESCSVVIKLPASSSQRIQLSAGKHIRVAGAAI